MEISYRLKHQGSSPKETINTCEGKLYTEFSKAIASSFAELGKGVTMGRTICFDTETTGLQPGIDEILQVSIVGEEGEILFNSYINPYFHDKWDDAQKVHGISPEDVKDAPYAHEVAKEVREIIESADVIITYNGTFDIRFLERWNIKVDLEKKTHNDVMLYFAKIYREWNEARGDYKWQKLTTCAEYYGFKFYAHNSLEDAIATMWCWQKMKESDFKRVPISKHAAVEKEC